MLQTKHLFNLLRWDLLRREHPGLAEAELTVLWGRATYRPYVDSDTIDGWAACVRERAARVEAAPDLPEPPRPGVSSTPEVPTI